MKSFYKIFSILFFLLATTDSYSQNHLVGFNAAPAYRIDNKTFGYSINLNYRFSIQKNYFFTLGYGQTYTSKKHPEVLSGFTILQRDQNNFAPLGFNPGWDESSFPGLSFDPNESLYHNHDFYLLYGLSQLKGKFNLSIGPVFSIREESQIDRYIYVEEYKFGPAVLNNIAIPIYGYANYLDVGAMLEFRYSLKTIGRLEITATNRFKYYPLNNSVIADLGLSLMVKI